MNEVAHILSPVNAGWVGWMMFALLVCAVLAECLQRGIITQAPLSLFSRSERTYKDAPVNFWAQVLITIFRIGTIAMAVNLCCYTGQSFTFASFGVVCGIIVGLLLVKMICHALLDYTFLLSRMFQFAYEHYANIITLAVVILYPVLLVLLRIGNPVAAQWGVGVIAGLFGLMWLYRGGRMFITSPLAIVYFILYFCTLELLPMAALYYLSELTIQIL